MGARMRLPSRRASETFELEAGGLRYTATVSRYDGGRIGELFLSNHKSIILNPTATPATRRSRSALRSNMALIPK